MGISSALTLKNKIALNSLLDCFRQGKGTDLTSAITGFHTPNARFNVVAPVNSIDGTDAFISKFVEPMHTSFNHLHRRSDMLFGGEYEGNEWVVSHGHYVGEFNQNWMGIPASGDIHWIQYVEYHRMLDDHAVESYLYLDMLDLLRQLGFWPLPPSNGYEGFVPGPATADGMVLSTQAAKESARSLQMVDDMLSRLYTEDEAWRPYWHRNMYWYGPSGYGSYIGVDGFAKFQLPYEGIFAKGRVRNTYIKSGDEELDTKVKGHYARFADGNYVASGGWPSHGGFMVAPWLGIEPEGQMFTVRVADIWRREGDQLVENWVFVDLIDMLLQLGFDTFAEAGINITLP